MFIEPWEGITWLYYQKRKGLESNNYVAIALIDMYAKCTDIDSAKEIFSRTEKKNIVTWNTMIGAYINRRQEYKAFNLVNRMLKEGIKLSHVTYMMLIPACGEIGALDILCLDILRKMGLDIL